MLEKLLCAVRASVYKTQNELANNFRHFPCISSDALLLLQRFLLCLVPQTLKCKATLMKFRMLNNNLRWDFPCQNSLVACKYPLRSARCASVLRILCLSVKTTCFSSALHPGVQTACFEFFNETTDKFTRFSAGLQSTSLPILWIDTRKDAHNGFVQFLVSFPKSSSII